MARLINTTAMTVDGVVDVGDWFVAVGDHDDAARSLFETDDAAMLVGRKSFEGFAAYWPSATGPWADVLNPMPKYVASRSVLGPLAWNATAIEADAVEGVRKLKAAHAGDLVMSGCGELARELIQAGLVDELYFWIHPAHPGTRRPPVRGGDGPSAAHRGEAVRFRRNPAPLRAPAELMRSIA
jgi:dihydrofolate reductase